jgi:hypothetical protein
MENKLNIPLWENLYEEIYRQCNKSWSKLYKFYGALGIRCLFKDAGDIKKLFDRDNAQAMEEPTLVRKNLKKNFSLLNCYFVEAQNYILDLLDKSYEKTEKEHQEKQEKINRRIEESKKRHELMWARQRALKEARKSEKEIQINTEELK